MSDSGNAVSDKSKKIVPIAMPGTHQNFLKYFKKQSIGKDVKILDLGAGHGAFTKTLFEMGYSVEACDLFPEHFYYEEIKCAKVDITEPFPYSDGCFDVVIAIEVSEHILDHENFFAEICRILKPGGKLFISTPNILSMKSRLRFMFRGFYYSFNPLEMQNYDGLQHIASMTLDQYNYCAVKHGFHKAEYAIDKEQKSSRWLLVLFYPWMWLYGKLKSVNQMHNDYRLLVGRILFLQFDRRSN